MSNKMYIELSWLNIQVARNELTMAYKDAVKQMEMDGASMFSDIDVAIIEGKRQALKRAQREHDALLARLDNDGE